MTPSSSRSFLADRSAVWNGHRNGATSMRYSDYKCFRFRFDSGVAFVSIDHPPINLLDEVLSQEFYKLGRELENDESVRVVVLQIALPDFLISHSGLGRVVAASKMLSHTISFRPMHSRTLSELCILEQWVTWERGF